MWWPGGTESEAESLTGSPKAHWQRSAWLRELYQVASCCAMKKYISFDLGMLRSKYQYYARHNLPGVYLWRPVSR
ncbi:MAG: hypothetical protein ACLVAT_02550 [Lachnospiraceae bacterium]